MATRQELKDVFKDTKLWIESDPALSRMVEEAKKETRVYFEGENPDFDKSAVRDMKITVTKDRSFQAAMRLHKELPNKRIAVMNFANAFHPGGGVEEGFRAQEESLCRTSTLYPVLNYWEVCMEFYAFHNRRKTYAASDSVIYSEGVVVCKTDEDLPKRMKKEDWIKVDVITAAAPDLRTDKERRYRGRFPELHLTDDELFDLHVERAKHILSCAAFRKADILVTGAFGCGAFKNNPETVAKAYKKVLAEFPKVFDRIEFAVFCPPNDTRNYDTFHRVLA